MLLHTSPEIKDSLEAFPYAKDGDTIYLNTSADARFVGSEQCADCHPDIFNSYLDSEMGRSMEQITPQNVIEQYPQREAVYDSVLNFYYEMVRRDGRFYQREYRLDKTGKIVHELLMEAQYAIGSGNNLRMYFYSEKGRLYEMPLTWYVHQKKWDLSPGYRDFGNLRFSRFAIAKCIACHNSYLTPIESSNDRYQEPFDLGIGCERCHGPGDLHVREMKGEKISLVSNKAKTIVNPRKLSYERQLDVCRQCHLQGKAWALNEGNEWFGFRPGMRLASHRSVYYPQKTSKEVFEVADSAQRLSLSKCFTASSGAMTCITCHNPHKSIKTFSRQYYNRRCQSCHLAENLYSLSLTVAHVPSDDCVSCHMNRTGTDNTLHGVSTTDHWIRVDLEKTEIDWSVLKLPDGMKPLVRLLPHIDAGDRGFDRRLGKAYFDYYKEFDSRKAYLDSAALYLSKGLDEEPDDGEAHFALGEILFALGEHELAAVSIEKAISLIPNNATFYHKLGKVFHQLKKYELAFEKFRQAIKLKPDVPSYLESMAKTALKLGEANTAITALEKAVQIDRLSPYTYYTLGNLYIFDLEQPEKALAYFENLVILDPDFPNGHLNLGNTYASMGRYQDAERTYQIDISMHPESSARPLANLGHLYHIQGRNIEAREAFQKALAIDPTLESAKRFFQAQDKPHTR